MRSSFNTLEQISHNFQRLMGEVVREALLEPKGADWCIGESCNERPLGKDKLFVDFLGEHPMIFRDRNLSVVSLVYITHPDDPTEEQPNRHYFVDLGGVVVLQTVPYPYGLRQISDTEIGDLAELLASPIHDNES